MRPTSFRPIVSQVRTPGFHPGNTGSNPVGVTTNLSSSPSREARQERGRAMMTLILSGARRPVAVLVTLAIERLGGHRGGLLGTLPRPSFLRRSGCTPRHRRSKRETALLMTPMGMFFNAVFLLCWRILPRRLHPRHAASAGPVRALSLTCWGTLASGGIWLMPRIHAVGLDHWSAGIAVLGLGLLVGILACIKNPPGPSATTTVGPVTLGARGLLAGLAIGSAIWLGTAGPHRRPGGRLPRHLPHHHGEPVVDTRRSGGGRRSGSHDAGWHLSQWLRALCCISDPHPRRGAGSAAAWVIAVASITLPSWWWMSRQRARSMPPA